MKYLMLAGGTGLAPMINVARGIVGDDNDITTIKLLYACKTYEDILLKSELKQLALHWNFTSKIFLSQVGHFVSMLRVGDVFELICAIHNM